MKTRVKSTPSMRFKRYIITIDGNPAAWCPRSRQLCIAHSIEWQDAAFPAKLYSLKKAQEYIKRTQKNRKKWFGIDSNDKYNIIPVSVK